MEKLNIDALKHPWYRGHEYKRIKRFRKEKKARMYLDELKKRYTSNRLPPIIEPVRVGLGLGYFYYVCIPKGRVIE